MYSYRDSQRDVEKEEVQLRRGSSFSGQPKTSPQVSHYEKENQYTLGASQSMQNMQGRGSPYLNKAISVYEGVADYHLNTEGS